VAVSRFSSETSSYQLRTVTASEAEAKRLKNYTVAAIHITAIPNGQSIRSGVTRMYVFSPLYAKGAGSLWPCGPLQSPRVLPSVLLVPLASSVCPPVLLASLLTPPCVLRCPWCLLDPTVVQL
jgi:hypothetical protein